MTDKMPVPLFLFLNPYSSTVVQERKKFRPPVDWIPASAHRRYHKARGQPRKFPLTLPSPARGEGFEDTVSPREGGKGKVISTRKHEPAAPMLTPMGFRRNDGSPMRHRIYETLYLPQTFL
jgi:hypothetical protein